MATFYDRFVACAERWPTKPAVEVQGPREIESYTYAELQQMSGALAGWLLDREIQSGSRVAILADNHLRWVAAYLGIIAAGGTVVPLDTNYDAHQVAKLLADSQSWLLISDQRHFKTAQEAARRNNLGLVLTEGRNRHPASKDQSPSEEEAPASAEAKEVVDFDQIFAQRRPHFRALPRAPDDLAALLYTSGTTADPKGVMLTHGNLLAETDAVFAWVHITTEDAILGVLPLFHVLSQMANLLLPLVAGARAVYLSTLNTTELLRGLRDRRITALAVVPQFFNLIHERIFKEVRNRGKAVRVLFSLLMRLNALSRRLGWNLGRVLFPRVHALFGHHMRYLVTGGSRFEPQIGRDFYRLGIDVLQAYGLTETCGGAFANSPEDNVIGSVGKPLKGVEAKIIDRQPSEDGTPGSGEILLRGPNVMKGYWNRPDSTSEVLKDGWLATGDLGYLDVQGNLFLTGRKKEVIILANGKNLYPEEIEAQYLASPFIQELCIMGIENGAGSDRLHAVIVPNFEVLRQRKVVNAKEVIRFDIEGLSAQLPSSKRISSYEIWQDPLPRTTTRKLKRFEIKERVRARMAFDRESEPALDQPHSEEEEAWLVEPEVQRALEIIDEYSPRRSRSIRPTDNLELDLGLDSMRRVELLVALEQGLGGHIEESRSSELYTVRDLVEAVRDGMAAGKKPATARLAGWSAVLEEEPRNPRVLGITKPRPVVDRIIFLLTRLVKLVWRTVSRLDVEGLEHIPRSGPYLLCSNHQSFFDPIPLLAVLPLWALKRMFAVGTSEIFGSGLMTNVARLLRVVVVDPDANLVPAMRAGAFGLRHGMALLMYPEGERSIDGTPKTFKKGAAILSIHLQVPIVPVAIDGFYEAWPRGKRFQSFAPLKIKIGEANLPPPLSQAGEEAYAKFTAELKAKIVAMWEQLRAEKGWSGSR